MADSEEECDTWRNRDKYPKERDEFKPLKSASPLPEPAAPPQYSQQQKRSYNNANNYQSPNKNQDQPVFKRQRRDMDDYNSGGGGGYHGNNNYNNVTNNSNTMNKDSRREQSFDNRYNNQSAGAAKTEDVPNYPTQPPMLLFKHFLQQQDDDIEMDDAMKKYNQYREAFVMKQLRAFFEAHSGQEWFKEKYLPAAVEKRRAELARNIELRREIFVWLMERGWMDAARIHVDENDAIVRLMDAVVILLEGGNEDDLAILDSKRYRSESPNDLGASGGAGREADSVAVTEKETEAVLAGAADKDAEMEPAEEGEKDDTAEITAIEVDAEIETQVDDNIITENIAVVSEATENESIGNEDMKEAAAETDNKTDNDADESNQIAAVSEAVVNGEGSEAAAAEPIDDKTESEAMVTEQITENIVESDAAPTSASDCNSATAGSRFDRKLGAEKQEPRALHKTFSIFLRNLHPNVLRTEIEALVKPYSGFLRLALQDPTPDRKFFRRGWVTYDRSVNIKEICWNLNNIRLHDCDIGAIVNRELTQRIRPVMVLANHRPVMRHDVRIAARLVAKFDRRHNLWQAPSSSASSATIDNNPMTSLNPLLANITEYLVDEGSYEEEALLGGNLNSNLELMSSSGAASDPANIRIEHDEKLSRVLDRLILYLRFVHSFDYYSTTEYQIEDEMPHRCGILHARGAHIHVDKPLSQREVEDYIKNFESKAELILNSVDTISIEEARKLGYKRVDEAVEQFMQENTQELSKDKWLCPLSGKKFKGPDFVHKHILNKHLDKIEQVKQNTDFFNNYLLDPRRPQLPEHPSNRPVGNRSLESGEIVSQSSNDVNSSGNNTNTNNANNNRYNRDNNNLDSNNRNNRSFGNNSMDNKNNNNNRRNNSDDYNDRRNNNNNYYRNSSPSRGGNYGDYGNRNNNGNSNNSNNNNNNGGNYYRKNSYSSRGGNQNRQRNGGGSGGGSYYNRKMLSYNDLDAPSNDD